MNGRNGNATPATPDECAAAIAELDLTEPLALELLEDYREFAATGKHRRPDVWADRDQLMQRGLPR